MKTKTVFTYLLIVIFVNILFNFFPPVQHTQQHLKTRLPRTIIPYNNKSNTSMPSKSSNLDKPPLNTGTSFSNLTLAPNEGDHIRFDKGWSRMNKFLTTNHSILKLGRSNIIHEWLAYQIATHLRLNHIFLQGPATYLHECHDMSKFEARFAHPLRYKLPVYGMLTQHLARAEQNSPGLWKQTAKCHDPQTKHMPELSAVDFIMGHTDRKANCHVMGDAVIPIVNDAVNAELSFANFKNPDQQNILYNMMMQQDSTHARLAHYLAMILPRNSFDNITLHKIISDAKQTFPCHPSDTQRVERLLVAIQYRWLQLQRWLDVYAKHPALSVLIFTMDSLATRVQAAQHGGPAGEIVVRSSLEASLRSLGCSVHVATSDKDYDNLAQRQNYSILIFDPWTVLEKHTGGVRPRQLARQQLNHVYVLDFFGSESNVLGIPSSRILSAFPTRNAQATFLGFSLTKPGPRLQIARNQGVIWGKDIKYYASKLGKSIIHTASSICTLVAISKHLNHDLQQHKNITFIGPQSVKNFKTLLQSSKFLLGLGHPLSGPSGLDAMQAGAMLIIPDFSLNPLQMQAGKHFESQHPYMTTFVGPPYVCTFQVLESGTANTTELHRCIERAVTTTLEPRIPDDFQSEVYEKRVAKIFNIAQ